jgi:hypothetical protein
MHRYKLAFFVGIQHSVTAILNLGGEMLSVFQGLSVVLKYGTNSEGW